eukprot:GCRY01005750.1.p1 GENE.GCRY01005750.1~~GCRY01005750.1.p1  ORF type:complete len:216 (+),score=23.56 GCRY01005750.1:108-755(+)
MQASSMQSSSRNILRGTDSQSLWNFSLNPGWTKVEAEILRACMIKYGWGKWTRIVNEGVLPGKTVSQMALQVQRMAGQQSLAEFVDLHIDPFRVGESNKLLDGVVRKNGLIINTEKNPTREVIEAKRKANTEKFFMSEQEIADWPSPKDLYEKMLQTGDDVVQDEKEKLMHKDWTLEEMKERQKVLQDRLWAIEAAMVNTVKGQGCQRKRKLQSS